MSKPSDFTLVLAVALAEKARPHIPGVDIVFANAVQGELAELGFSCSTQQVAAWLKRIASKELPPVERSTDGWWAGAWGYRVTQWGCNELWNRGLKNFGPEPVTSTQQIRGER